MVVKTLSNLGQALLQTSYEPELLSKKPRGSVRETCPPCGRNVITASFHLVFSSTGNMGRRDIRAEIKTYSGFVWPFCTLIEFPRHLMSIIRILTTNTCSSSPKWLEKDYTCVLGCMFWSHARNGNELQPYWCPGSSSNISNLGF